MKLDTIDAQEENLYILSELGRKLLKYGMLRSAHVDNHGGTSVNGVLTNENIISKADIDSMFNLKNDNQ